MNGFCEPTGVQEACFKVIDPFHQTNLLRASPNVALNTAGDWAFTAFLHNLFQCPTILRSKELLPMSNITFFSSKQFPLVLLLHALVKNPSTTLLQVL